MNLSRIRIRFTAWRYYRSQDRMARMLVKSERLALSLDRALGAPWVP